MNNKTKVQKCQNNTDKINEAKLEWKKREAYLAKEAYTKQKNHPQLNCDCKSS